MLFESVYPYIIVFVLNFLEGSVVTIGAGLITQSVGLNPWITMGVLVISDIVSDLFYYFVGKMGSRLLTTRYAKFISVTPRRIAMIKGYYQSHGVITLIFAKLSDVLAMPGVIIAGVTGMNMRSFLLISTLCAIAKTAVLYVAGLLIANGLIHASISTLAGLFSGLVLLTGSVVIFTYFYKKLRKQDDEQTP